MRLFIVYRELLSVFDSYTTEPHPNNLLLLSSNPLLSLALTAELLDYMASHRRMFENECRKVAEEVLSLGKMLLSKIEEERYYEKIMMSDRDFKDRSILKIITENYFEHLLDEEDPKGENLMVKLWHGVDATKCDGNIYGFSSLTHILMTRAKKTGGGEPFFSLITNFFEVNLE